jgi:GAF domain-containing protein
MALPLRVGNKIIGALDVQSKEEGAFDNEDITILQVLADQLAVAIQNSQLLAEVQQALDELQVAYGDYTRHTWKEWTEGTYASGYRYTGAQVEPTEENPPEVIQVWEKDQLVQVLSGDESVLAIPIRLRNITLGVINLSIEGGTITEEMVNLVNDIADRLALALENARLLSSTQQRASQEQLIGEITSRMRETLDVEAVIKTAVQDIRKALELHDISIQLEPSIDSFIS